MAAKVVLAYSGGLDTSCILKWLLEEGYEVICFMADIGQEEDFKECREKAIKIGASEVIIKDIKADFVTNYVWPAIQMGLVYEERYLLGTSLARPCISVALVEVAKAEGATFISHGATGKGNDQVRFELSAYALCPGIKIIAPWRDDKFCKRFQGRQDLMEYARTKGIPVSATPKEPWSTDANLLHISYESGILENPMQVAPDELYQMTANPHTAPNIPYQLTVHFEHGLPILIEDRQTTRTHKEPLEMLNFLNKIGGKYGVGRIDIVENRFVGLKSRGVYETPGGTILYTAHQDLEIFCLDREVYRTKRVLAEKMADYIYNGFWFSPEASYTRKCLELSQTTVTGKVVVEITPRCVRAVARNAPKGLYNEELVSMDLHGNYSSADASGFIAINSVRVKEYSRAFGGYLD